MLVWRFYLLNDKQKEEARIMFESKNIIGLMEHLNDHCVSPKYLTPCCDYNDTVTMTMDALKTGKLDT